MGVLGKLAEVIHGHADPTDEYSVVEEVTPVQVAVQLADEVAPTVSFYKPLPQQAVINDVIAPWEIPALEQATERSHQPTNQPFPVTASSHAPTAESVSRVRHMDVLPIYL